MKTYIKESSQKTQKNVKEFMIHNKVYMFIKDPFIEKINLKKVIDYIEQKIPSHMFDNVETVYIGDFEEFHERNINALYKDGAIYVTNHQSDELDLIDDVVHELAHSIEEPFWNELYSDGMIEGEFLGKRKRLYSLLKTETYGIYLDDMLNIEYSEEFDEFLYKSIGYEKLANISTGLFVSPYGITSLREYFANGFEEYFIRDPFYLKKISPQIFNKIEQIANYNKDDIGEY